MKRAFIKKSAISRNFGPQLWAVDPLSGCWIWQRAHGRYGHFFVKDASKVSGKRLVLAHRHAYALFKGVIPEGLCVLHRCDVPRCVNPEHLFLGSQSSNAVDREAKGRGGRGNAKLSAATAARIRDICRVGGATRAEVGRYFGVTGVQIGTIARGKAWASV